MRSRVGGWVSVGWGCSALQMRGRVVEAARDHVVEDGGDEIGGGRSGLLGGDIENFGDARLNRAGAEQRPRGGIRRSRPGAGGVGGEFPRPAPVPHGEVEPLHHKGAEA